MNLDNNVGDVYLRLDADGAGCSPAIEAILPAGSNPEAVIAAVNADITAALVKHLGKYEVAMGESFGFSVRHSRIIGTKEEESRRWDEFWSNPLGLSSEEQAEQERRAEKAQAAWDEAVKSHPQNGKLGWWRVENYRRELYVRAVSCAEAVEKADLTATEMPEWIGEELPDVIEC